MPGCASRKRSRSNSRPVRAQRLAAAVRRVAGLVDHQVAVDQPPRSHRCRDPAEHRVDAQRELARAERLGHVVVGADLEADHPVGLLAQRGQHDDRDVALLPQPAAHLDAVDARQHQVEHDEVVRLPRRTAPARSRRRPPRPPRGRAARRYCTTTSRTVGSSSTTSTRATVTSSASVRASPRPTRHERQRRQDQPARGVVAVEERGVVRPRAEPAEHGDREQGHRAEHHEADDGGRPGHLGQHPDRQERPAPPTPPTAPRRAGPRRRPATGPRPAGRGRG